MPSKNPVARISNSVFPEVVLDAEVGLVVVERATVPECTTKDEQVPDVRRIAAVREHASVDERVGPQLMFGR